MWPPSPSAPGRPLPTGTILGVDPSRADELAAAYRLGGLRALGEAHGAFARERGWKLLGY